MGHRAPSDGGSETYLGYVAPFEGQIRTWYFGEKLIGSRIVRELRARGYDGSSSPLCRLLTKLSAGTA